MVKHKAPMVARGTGHGIRDLGLSESTRWERHSFESRRTGFA